MKTFKRIAALVIAAMMVLGTMSSALADGAAQASANGTYTISIENTNTDVSIKKQVYSAYKLFETTYVATGTSVNGLDQTPHAYYIKKGSPFFDFSSSSAYVETKSTNGVTTYEIKASLTDEQKATATKESSIYNILKHFTLTEITGQDTIATNEQLVLVEPKDTFDAADAYVFSQEMAPIIAEKESALASGWKATRLSTASDWDTEIAVIDVSNLGAGYYLVTGGGVGKAEDGSFTGKAVTAAIALTTTDPKAKIKAKIDAPKVEKKIDETETPKYNEKAIGDTVPYEVTSDVPNLTGFENYFFILNDTMSKGLSLNDNNANVTDGKISNVHFSDDTNKVVDNGFYVTITKSDGSIVELTRAADYVGCVALDNATTKVPYSYYVVKNTANNSFEVVFHNFIQYKGNLIVDDDADSTFTGSTHTTYDYRTLNVDKSRVGTYYSEFENATITVRYSATVNEKAMIGETGNVNTASIEFSNKPDGRNGGKPNDNDRPGEGEGFDTVTEISPKSKTVTYTTGLKALKYTGSEKTPLAGAEFTLVGENLMNLVVESKEVYRATKQGETADIYVLTGNRYTTDAPTADKILDKDGNEKTITGNSYTLGAYEKIQYGTLREYVGFNSSQNHVTVTTLHGTEDVYTAVDASIVATLKKDTLTNTSLKKFRKAGATDTDTSKYYKLNADGTYTQDSTVTAADAYVEDTRAWSELTQAEKDALTSRQIVTTDANGIVLFRGLAAGYYTLTETKAPDGYNKLAQPIEIYVDWGVAANAQQSTNVQDADQCTWVIKVREKGDSALNQGWDATGVKTLTKDDFYKLFNLEIENNAGTELPSTGGVGTYWIYTIGAVLVLAGAILLVSKRRAA